MMMRKKVIVQVEVR